MQHLDGRFLVVYRSRAVQRRVCVVTSRARTAGLALAAVCGGFLAFGGTPTALAQGKAVGPTMCACPGGHRELGSAATCEEACFGKKPGAGGYSGPGIDYGAIEAQRRAQEEAAEAERYEKIRVDLEYVMSVAMKHPSPQARYEAYVHARDLYRQQQAIRDSAFLRDALSRVEAKITWYSGVLDSRNKNYLSAKDKLMAAYRARPDLFNEEDHKFIAEVNRQTFPQNSSRAIVVPPGEETVASAIAIQKKRLAGRDAELTAAISRDVLAIKNLGFDRRAEDFAQWESLGAEAKASFEREIVDSATEVALAKARSSVLEGFRAFDATKAARWIDRLSKVDPRPVELIGMIERLAKVKDKAQIAESAELILDRIEKLQKTGELLRPSSTVQAREELMLVGLDLVCDVVPPPGDTSCSAFKTIGKLTVASLYNNATRRVALREVERLTNMTEAQLLGLAKINELMVRHVRERNEVRAKLKALP